MKTETAKVMAIINIGAIVKMALSTSNALDVAPIYCLKSYIVSLILLAFSPGSFVNWAYLVSLALVWSERVIFTGL